MMCASRITPVQSKLFGGAFRGTMPPRPDRWLAEGDVIKTGELSARVMHTPRHSPGACCFHLEEEGLLFSGEIRCLLARSVSGGIRAAISSRFLLRSIG